MRLEFESIEIEHFKSFASKQKLSFAERGPGAFFMRGRNDVEPRLGANGAGKSTLLGDAVTWCLYGKTASGLKNPDLKSWGSTKTPLVALSLKLDGKPQVISRSATTNGLKINGQEVGSEEAAKLIGLDFEVFTNTILLAQGQPLFFDRSPKDKMQLFTDVLQLERWEDRSSAASAKVRELEQLAAEMTGELTGAEAALVQTEELLAKTKERSAEWEAERQKLSANVDGELKEKKALLEQQRGKLGGAELAWDGAATELKALRKQLPELNQKARQAAADYNTANAKEASLKRDLERLGTEFDALEVAKECPTCHQSIKKVGLKQHKAELLDRIAEVEEALEKIDLKPLQKAVNTIDLALVQANKATEAFAAKEEKARTELDYLKPQVAELQAEVSALTAAQTAKTNERNPYIDQAQELRRKKSQGELAITELKEDLAKAGRQVERTRFWVKGFKDVKLYLIEEVLQELELTTNVMLAEVGLEGWQVTYDVEKETKSGTIQRGLNVAILSPRNKQAVRYESWSGGEGQRLRIVGALALSEVLLNHAGVSCNIEVLDEPTRHLSTNGVADLCDYLSERASRLERQIWVIDHTMREGQSFVGTVTVVKTPKGSVIEE